MNAFLPSQKLYKQISAPKDDCNNFSILELTFLIGIKGLTQFLWKGRDNPAL